MNELSEFLADIRYLYGKFSYTSIEKYDLADLKTGLSYDSIFLLNEAAALIPLSLPLNPSLKPLFLNLFQLVMSLDICPAFFLNNYALLNMIINANNLTEQVMNIKEYPSPSSQNPVVFSNNGEFTFL